MLTAFQSMLDSVDSVSSRVESAVTQLELLQDADVPATTPLDLSPECIAEFSSTLTQKERGKLLKRFGIGKVKCLVCGGLSEIQRQLGVEKLLNL